MKLKAGNNIKLRSHIDYPKLSGIGIHDEHAYFLLKNSFKIQAFTTNTNSEIVIDYQGFWLPVDWVAVADEVGHPYTKIFK